jgi:bifunctional enzyme CysN/CysC
MVDRRFEATLVWMNERPLDLEKSYLLKHTTTVSRVEIEALLSRTNLETLRAEPAETLELNDIGTVRVHCHRPLYFDPYRENRRTGAFVLIDSLSNGTVAAGMILGTASGAGATDTADGPGRSMVSPREREERLGQRGAVVLLYGLPGAGKSELAYTVERLLHDQGRFALVIDPQDSLSLENPELKQHPEELAASVLELARRAAEAGLIVLLPFAAPRAESRQRWQTAVGSERWIEVCLDTPIEVCKQRAGGDFYAKHAVPSWDPPRSGAGASAPARVDGSSVEAAGRFVVDLLERSGRLKPR